MQPGGPKPDESRNVILAIVLSGLILFAWEFFYARPQQQKMQAEQARIEQQHQAQAANNPPPAAPLTREQAIAATSAARVPITSNSVDGSILLQGARFDDLSLRNYRETVARNSPEVKLLTPNNAVHGYDAFFGWEDQNSNNVGVGANETWNAPAGAQLTPQTPLVLTYNSPDGLAVTRTVTLDANYMIAVSDEVRNTGAAPRVLRPFGVVRREGLPPDIVTRGPVAQGFAGAFGPNTTLQIKSYNDAENHAKKRDRGEVGDQQRLIEQQGPGGWLGISDHYWLTAIVVDHSEPISAYYDSRHVNNLTDYRAAYRGQWRTIAPGQSVTYAQRLFAGAKRVDVLQAYQSPKNNAGAAIPHFDEAVDWGNMSWPLTRPFFALLDQLAKLARAISPTYAFALAILMTTIVIRAVFFPIMYNSYKSMAKLRELSPKMKEVQERYAADKQRQQQEMMKLYQTEKINPISGCLPMFLQIPVFFALYKTLSVTIEMRHAPFFGWVHDLSAPDPTSIFNLFGLLPYNPHTIPLIGGLLGIGLWPIFYGFAMWTLQKLSPPPPDPVQAQIFQILPLVFVFMMAGLPSGLLIYYTWSNLLLILQQYVIMRRQGVETQFDLFIKKRLKKKDALPATAE